MITFTITPDGGAPYELVAGSRDVLIWERTGKGRAFSQFQDGLRMGSLYELAHVAAKRQGLFDGSLGEFEQTCDLDTADEDDEAGAGREPDPTQTDR